MITIEPVELTDKNVMTYHQLYGAAKGRSNCVHHMDEHQLHMLVAHARVFGATNALGPTGMIIVDPIREDQKNKWSAKLGVSVTRQTCSKIKALLVHPSNRRSGIGQALLAHTIDTSKKSGLSHLFAWTIIGDNPAQTLFQKNGFTAVRGSETDDHKQIVLLAL